MQYTCWLMIEPFIKASGKSIASGPHWAMIERCRRTLTALWVPLFSLFSSHSPRESSSLLFIWFSWAGAQYFGVPHSLLLLIPASYLSELPAPAPHPQDVALLTLPLSCPSRTSQRSAPCLSSTPRSPSTSLFIYCQTDPPHKHKRTHSLTPKTAARKGSGALSYTLTATLTLMSCRFDAIFSILV